MQYQVRRFLIFNQALNHKNVIAYFQKESTLSQIVQFVLSINKQTVKLRVCIYWHTFTVFPVTAS